jgi:peptidoglycan/LPS O-acetylase OafA/YrhL
VTAASTGQARDGAVAGPGLPADLTKVRHLARHQIMGLTGTFLLGMAVNLIGLPSQTSGGAHIASLAFLAAHVLIALGMVLGAVMLLRAIPDKRTTWRKQAVLGAAAISVTTAAGVLTLLTKSNWWSYAMAAGFITALLTYGSILAQPEPRGRRPGDLPVARE